MTARVPTPDSWPAEPPFAALEQPPAEAPERGGSRALSRELWGIDWQAWLPRRVTDDGVSVHAEDFAAVAPFIEAHYPTIFERDQRPSRFRSGGSGACRVRYYQAVGDFFAFRHGGDMVAVLVCTPLDWSTYYLRSAAALPEYQGRGLVPRFFPFLFERLREAGVERVEAEASPSNFASLQNLLRHRFNVTGSVLSERWGALVRLTRFLNDEATDVFLEQFCDGVRYQGRASR